MKLLIATHNPGKRREFQGLLAGLPIDTVTLDEMGIHQEVDETGETLAENARLKAQAYSERTGLITLADDSGLEVDALGGEPGVMSKRYAGDLSTDAERNAFLLEKLKHVPEGERTARFRCAIAIAEPSGRLWAVEGTCEGAIAFESRGTHGFGYDPVFVVAARGAHMAELEADEKNRISHRASAARRARPILERLANDQGQTKP
jgi:XTP/dITP diphosphohydrolase